MAGTGTRGPAAGPALVGVVAISALAGIMRATEPVLGGPDPFWHWDLGRRIVNGWLPTSDPYSFLTDGQPWVLNQWGTELLIGAVDAIGGLQAVAILAALLVGIAYLHAGWRMWRRAPSLLTVGLFGLVYMAGMSNLTLRGNLFSYLLVAVVLGELQREHGPHPLVVVPVMALWANLHAGFLMGLALVLVHAVGEVVVADPARRRRLAGQRGLLLLGSLAATTVTPYGPRLLLQTLDLSGTGVNSGISEWASPALTSTSVLPYTGLVAVALVALALSAGRRDLPDVLVVVAFALLGASAVRNIAPAAIVVGITAAPHLLRAVRTLRGVGEAAPGPVRTLDRFAVMVLGLVGVVATTVLVPATAAVAPHAALVPLSIVDQLQSVQRPVRAHVTSLWAPAVAILADEVRTTVDGRLELFSRDDFRAATTIDAADPGWLDQLDAWCVTDVIVPADSPAGAFLGDVDGWNPVMTADVAGTDGDAEAVWHQRSTLPAGCP